MDVNKLIGEKIYMINKIQISKKDLELLDWVNQHGFANIRQISFKFGVTNASAYNRVHRLVKHEYLIHQRVFHQTPGVYRTTTLATKILNCKLPALSKISIANFQHNWILVDLSLALQQKFAGEFITERALRSGIERFKIGKKSHISDGILILDNKKIAIELELSCKAKLRLEKIIREYLKNFEIDEAWYFYHHSSVKNLLQPYAEKYGIFKLIPLSDYLNTSADSLCLKSEIKIPC